MEDEGGRLQRVERAMETVLRRLEALEGRASAPEFGESLAEPSAGEGSIHGTLTYSGSVRLGSTQVVVGLQEDLPQALEADPESVSQVFSALGSPFRILLLRALLEGPRTSQELQAVLDVGPVGQLYHHLKELQAAGLVVQRRRSVYAIPEARLFPLCVVLGAVPRLLRDERPAPSTGDVEADREES